MFQKFEELRNRYRSPIDCGPVWNQRTTKSWPSVCGASQLCFLETHTAFVPSCLSLSISTSSCRDLSFGDFINLMSCSKISIWVLTNELLWTWTLYLSRCYGVGFVIRSYRISYRISYQISCWLVSTYVLHCNIRIPVTVASEKRQTLLSVRCTAYGPIGVWNSVPLLGSCDFDYQLIHYQSLLLISEHEKKWVLKMRTS